MSIYFNEHGSAIGYLVEGRWLIKGDYLQIDQGPNIPGGLYKINDNKVKFPFDYKEVEGVIDTEKLTFTICGIEYKMRKAKTNPWDV
ncbi:hypothetical protein [Enterobacter hormaechei]|uniref:hypothetical protein n=1 Tax=Enterobacter hormaechei TaxID=158836 RepID=UPI0029DAADA0|nr:hypothetical protein [Enterobacter hormaechei]MDX7123052.1 hypothetical protein [Enterobacter hormaechei]